ncbi:UNVERIFIED_CONTAM: hypothetical protein FKN15_026289 [Acipenser sinensis]
MFKNSRNSGFPTALLHIPLLVRSTPGPTATFSKSRKRVPAQDQGQQWAKGGGHGGMSSSHPKSSSVPVDRAPLLRPRIFWEPPGCSSGWSPDLPLLLHGQQLPFAGLRPQYFLLPFRTGSDPRRSRAGSDPRRSGAGSDPRRSRAGSDPRRSRAGSDPRRSRAGSDPRRSGTTGNPRRSGTGSNPRHSRTLSNHRRMGPQATPDEAGQAATTGEAGSQATPGKAGQAATLSEAGSSAAPGDEEQQAAPGDA